MMIEMCVKVLENVFHCMSFFYISHVFSENFVEEKNVDLGMQALSFSV